MTPTFGPRRSRASRLFRDKHFGTVEASPIILSTLVTTDTQ
jgi:hypothetical protein